MAIGSGSTVGCRHPERTEQRRPHGERGGQPMHVQAPGATSTALHGYCLQLRVSKPVPGVVLAGAFAGAGR